MITPGLVSVTFRKLDVASVVSLAAEPGLTSIEWGADVHVPVGDSGAAAVARKLCAEAGLEISSYGSYYRADTDVGEFESVVTTAVALGAPSIRVWAGRVGSDGASLEQREAVARAVADAAELAVFSWAADGTRLPLADRDDLWRPVLAELAASERRHHTQLEFVAGDDPSRFHADAATLQAWIRELGEAP